MALKRKLEFSLVTFPSYFLANDFDDFSILFKSILIFLLNIEGYKSAKFQIGREFIACFFLFYYFFFSYN
mgnify:CR=1 FL=1